MNLLFEEYPAYAFVLSTDRLCYLSRDSTVSLFFEHIAHLNLAHFALYQALEKRYRTLKRPSPCFPRRLLPSSQFETPALRIF